MRRWKKRAARRFAKSIRWSPVPRNSESTSAGTARTSLSIQRCAISTGLFRRRSPLDADAFHFGGGNQALVHHALDLGNQAADVFGGVHDGHHNRLIAPHQVRAMNFGCLSVALETAKYRGAGN